MLLPFSIPEDGDNAKWNRDRSIDSEQYEPSEVKQRSAANEAVRRNVANLSGQIVHNEGFRRGQLLQRWFDILGEGIGANACPRYIKNGTLFVTCASPIWSQELTLQQSAILERFNEILPPEKQLQKIHCKVGRIKLPVKRTETRTQLPFISLTEEEQQKVNTLVKQSANAANAAMIAKVYAQNLIHNRQLRQMGAIPCARCQRLSFTGSPCMECRRQERENTRLETLRLLDQQPWMKYSDLQERLPQLTLGEFLNYHLALASSWRENIRRAINALPKGTVLPDDLQVAMIKLVALTVSKPYNELSEGEVKLALYKRYGEALLTRTAPGAPGSA